MVVKILKENRVITKERKLETVEIPSFYLKILLGYFDKEIQGHPTISGVGLVLYITPSHCFYLKYVGIGTNNTPWFFAFFLLLTSCKQKGYRWL